MIVVCGEALIDLVPTGEPDTYRAVPGGGPANTAVALSRLGTPARLLCRLSGDGFGRRLRDHLVASGVDLSLAVEAAEPTTAAVVGLDNSGGAAYQFYVQGTADWQWAPAELPAELPPGTRALHFGTLASILPPGAEVLRAWAAAQREHATVVYDVNVRPVLLPDRARYRAAVDPWLKAAHVVKASDDDLAWLYPERDPLDTARAWIGDHGLAVVLLTCGAEGAVAVTPSGPPVRVPGFPVKVVDTVGAGDTFTGALLHALAARGALPDRTAESGSSAGPDQVSASPGPEFASRSDLADALRFAVAAAAITCTRAGAVPPTRAEVDGFLRDHEALDGDGR
ncbi:carbohydrate kinase [Thermopolyspora sp. NPDC052614]|uniref:carbohydrate kinase family protein n=1 Tax=Thermopolyspora sp. NPDC052614 TaxID=3155682 RepID=UPI00342B2A44